MRNCRIVSIQVAMRRLEGKRGKLKMLIVVNDPMQKGYRYELSAQTGRNFDPGFKPELTPKQMLELGVFCGKYMTDTQAEFPESWFELAKLSLHDRDCSLNYFGVDASQPLSVWQNNGWLHSDDPRGWFQWYCRYYMGRRMPEEESSVPLYLLRIGRRRHFDGPMAAK